MPSPSSPKPLTDELERRRIIPLSQAAEITSLSEDSLRRHHRDKIRKIGPRRIGMRLGDVLDIGENT